MRILGALIFILLLSLPSFSSACGVVADKVYQIGELNKISHKDEVYYIEGYVAKVYECPPCEKGSVCKPCMPANMVVSSSKKEMSSYSDVTNEDIIIYTNDIRKVFSVGEKYKFLIKMYDHSGTSHNAAKLLEYNDLYGN